MGELHGGGCRLLEYFRVSLSARFPPGDIDAKGYHQDASLHGEGDDSCDDEERRDYPGLICGSEVREHGTRGEQGEKCAKRGPDLCTIRNDRDEQAQTP